VTLLDRSYMTSC